MNERVCFACHHSLKIGVWPNVRLQDRNDREELEYGQDTPVPKWQTFFFKDTKMGTMDFPWSSHSSSSKTILFLASPPHLRNSGSFQTNYKKKFVKEKGKSNYSIMLEPPDVKHAMDVAKKQSNVSPSSHSLGPTCTRGSHTGAWWAGPREWPP